MIIHSISGPRNISTSLMYSFAQRSDTKVVDEPFYAAYLANDPTLDHPGRDLILRSQCTDPMHVYQQIIERGKNNSLFYVKDMAHHFARLHLIPFPNSKALFLVRDPEKLIASYQKVMAKPRMEDIGLKDEWELFQMYQAKEIPAFVVPTEKLAQDPGNGLFTICTALGIDFDESMLSWPKGKKPYDGIWETYWYKSTHESTGFAPFPINKNNLDEHGEMLLNRALPYYHNLMKNSIL